MPTLASNMSSLKNLQFGNDRPGGGNSGQPYIKNPTYLRDPVGISDVITHTATDVIRMTKFLADVPRGPLFIAKQVGLQLTNPQLEHKTDFNVNRNTNKPTSGQGLFGNTGNFLSNTTNSISNSANKIQNAIGSNRIWSPINFLAQIAGAGAGKNIPRHGFSLEVSESDKYPYIVRANNLSGNNRIINLTKPLRVGKYSAEGTKELFSYTGGASSYLGIGKTVINSYYSTFAASDLSNPDNTLNLNGFRPLSPILLAEIGDDASVESISLRNIDFRAYKMSQDTVYADEVRSKSIRITDYSEYNTSKRIGVINTNASNGPVQNNDAVNMVSLFYGSDPLKKNTDINGNIVNPGKGETGNSVRDLIKFQIKAIDNDNPGSGVYMIFRAFLDSLNDSMEANWNPTKYVGRGESFYGYDGFTANYSVSFTISAFSRDEMKPLYQKLNYLKSTLAPDYKNNKMRGNIIELTVGDYIKHQPGFISSLNINLPENAAWEIAMNEPDNTSKDLDKDMHELPHLLKVDMSFTPIYNFLPRKSSSAPFIGIGDTESRVKVTRGDDKKITNITGVTQKNWLTPYKNNQFDN